MTTMTVRTAVDDLLALDRPGDAAMPPDPSYFHDLGRAGHALCGALFNAERDGEARPGLLALVEPVRRMHARAPFISRLQAWPRGYPGDFETIEYLWQGRAAGSDTTSWCLERQALASPIAQQHRNKVFEQARRFREAMARPHARVLVLACGSSPDVRTSGLSVADFEGREVYLTDTDAGALAFSRDQLGPLADRCEFILADALRALRRATGTFDLILAGGLFDYLSDRLCRRLIELAADRLVPGGQFFFTNIAAGNPYRTWIEYLGDWQLIERNDAQIRELTRGVSHCDLTMTRDQTGLAILATLRRH
jgi:extracellular factor (EF) 3-hydroxypalmitic acid methyl ester biosynthesis protein